MRPILPAILTIVVMPIVAWSATPPERINFQGVLRDAAGGPVDGPVPITVGFYDSDAGCPGAGTPLITEDHGAVTVTQGLFQVALGSGTVSPGSVAGLRQAFSDHAEVWLEIRIDGETLCPRTRVESTAYALNAARLDGLEASSFAGAVHAHSGEDITDGTVAEPRIAGAIARDDEVLSILLEHDGEGSGLDADRLDGRDASTFLGAGGVGRPGHAVTRISRFGENAALTIGADGLPILAYWDADTEELMFARCEDLICGKSTTPLSLGAVPRGGIALTIQADDNPIVALRDGGQLWLFRCQDLACSSVDIELHLGNGGSETAITVGADGLPIMASPDSGNLVVSRCKSADCTDVSANTIAVAGYTAAITIDDDGLPLIGVAGQGHFLYVRCEDPECVTASTYDAGSSMSPASIAIGWDSHVVAPALRDGPHGSNVLEVASCDMPTCQNVGLSAVATVDGPVEASTAIGSDGMPLVAYRDSVNGTVHVVRCSTPDCSIANTPQQIHAGAPNEAYGGVEVTIGVDGLPLVAFWQEDGGLFVAHCSNRACIPWHRRR